MQVTKQEFETFISNYKNPLTKDVATICTPPVLCYYDFEESEGFDAMVATLTRELDRNYKETGEISYRIIDKTTPKAKPTSIKVVNHDGSELAEDFTPFNPDKCKLMLGGVEVVGFGESKIEISREEDV